MSEFTNTIPVSLSDFSTLSDITTLTFPQISHELEILLKEISITGKVQNEWKYLVRLIAAKMINVLKLFYSNYGFTGPFTETFEKRLNQLLKLLFRFDDAPFTIQRLLELLVAHTSQYKETHKFMNGIEKLLSVSSTLSAMDVEVNKEKDIAIVGMEVVDLHADIVRVIEVLVEESQEKKFDEPLLQLEQQQQQQVNEEKQQQQPEQEEQHHLILQQNLQQLQYEENVEVMITSLEEEE